MRAIDAVPALLLVGLAVVVVVQTGVFAPPPSPEDYENATVVVRGDGEVKATVEVRVADTRRTRRVGLSRTATLSDGEGMLFVHPGEGTHAYVMRNMSFPLDIVFVAANGTITTIHHAPTEPGESGGALTRYRGRGKYVLEVPRGYTNRTGIAVGDTVEVPASVG